VIEEPAEFLERMRQLEGSCGLATITPAKTMAAITAVARGVCVSLGLMIDSRIASHATQLQLLPRTVDFAVNDSFAMAPHGYDLTHVDAPNHVALDGRVGGGLAFADVVDDSGLRAGDVTTYENGLVTRGVLLDVAAARGVDHLRDGEYVSDQDLATAEQLAGVRVEPGDAVFVRTGARSPGRPPRAEDAPREGLSLQAIAWVAERRVSMYSGDCVERMPSEVPGLPLPLHQVGMAILELIMLDNTDVESLRVTCATYGQHSFLLVVAPLRLARATASPVNPLAVF
jgi:kynurenine formamidase